MTVSCELHDIFLFRLNPVSHHLLEECWNMPSLFWWFCGNLKGFSISLYLYIYLLLLACGRGLRMNVGGFSHQIQFIAKYLISILNSTYQLCFLLSSCLFRMFVMLHRTNVLKLRALKGTGLMCVCFLIKEWVLPITVLLQQWISLTAKKMQSRYLFGCADGKTEPAGSDVGAPVLLHAR